MKIVDSNVWISFFNREDVNNTRAREVLSELMRGDLCVTDYIILEVSTILTQKAGKDIANAFLDFIQNAMNVRIIYSSEVVFTQYLDFFRGNDFIKLSFVDQSLLYLSKDFEIVTFDKELDKKIKI